jgi:hypothetical protein
MSEECGVHLKLCIPATVTLYSKEGTELFRGEFQVAAAGGIVVEVVV